MPSRNKIKLSTGSLCRTWYAALAELIQNREKRGQIAENARKMVLEHHLISKAKCEEIK